MPLVMDPLGLSCGSKRSNTIPSYPFFWIIEKPGLVHPSMMEGSVQYRVMISQVDSTNKNWRSAFLALYSPAGSALQDENPNGRDDLLPFPITDHGESQEIWKGISGFHDGSGWRTLVRFVLLHPSPEESWSCVRG